MTVLYLLSLPVFVRAADEHPPQGYMPSIDLPEGEGRELVARACTRCHDLAGLAAYKGYWNRHRWRSMVATMVQNGAELDAEQAEVVTDYLTRFFGPGTRE